MRPIAVIAAAVLLVGAAVLVWLLLPSHSPVTIPEGVASTNAGMAERGAYLVRAAGCITCHTNAKGGGQAFAGGVPLKTPFGTFYSPNITPDKDTGIGAWSDEDFVRALTMGEGVHGEQLYPVLPYTSYNAMRVEDVLAIKAYLASLPPIAAPQTPNEISFPFTWRALLKGWKFLFFEGAAPLADDSSKDPSWNRGRYLVAVGHCAECHTPRNNFGAREKSAELEGNPQGPENWKVPALKGAKATDFAQWSVEEIAEYLKSGAKPDFDSAQGPMAEVIKDGTQHLTDEDRQAIAHYLKSLNGN